MAVRTKGLTVTIDGDTTGLTKALSNVNKEIKNFLMVKSLVHFRPF